MPFVEMPGIVGLVYVPDEEDAASKKHNCPDCFHCQWCSDARCAECRREKKSLPGGRCTGHGGRRRCRKGRARE